MSIQLNYNEDFSKGLKRLMIEECNTALKYLEEANDSEKRHKAVHEARKAFKKIRACLRLVRDQVDYYDEQNAWFRDRGREISDIRDATAHLEVMAMLEEQYDDQLYKNSFDKLQKKLENYREQLAEKVFNQDEQLKSIRDALKEKVETIPGWPLDIQSFDDIRPSIKRTYKRGCKGLQQSMNSGKIEDFHEWRKRVKYLRYQLDILNRLWPQVFEALEDELHEVTDLTGTLNDLQNLQNTISALDDPFSDEKEKILFYALAEKQQSFMKKHALLLGRKFYIDSPSGFCDRLEVYWNTHQEEIDSREIPEPSQLEYS